MLLSLEQVKSEEFSKEKFKKYVQSQSENFYH